MLVDINEVLFCMTQRNQCEFNSPFLYKEPFKNLVFLFLDGTTFGDSLSDRADRNADGTNDQALFAKSPDLFADLSRLSKRKYTTHV